MDLKKEHLERIALALLLGLWVLFNYRVLFQGHSYLLVDTSGFFYPLWAWGSRCFKAGFLPLWNPDVAFGTPYLADPEMGAFYPPLRLAYAFLSPVDAFRFLIIGHQLWALWGLWLFGKDLKFDPWARLFGCLAFGFSFNALSLENITAMFFAFSWIPWVALAWRRLWEKPSAGTALGYSVTLAMQMVSGYPIFAYLTGLVLGADMTARSVLAWRKGRTERPRILRWVGWSFAGGLLALVFNLVWLLPFAEFLRTSNLDQRLGMAHGIEWKHLASWLNPFFTGHPLHSYAGLDPTVSIYFVGLPTLALLVYGLVRRRLEAVLLGVLAGAFILSTGSLLGVGEWLKAVLPGYKWVVRSGYLIPWVVFYAAWGAMQVSSQLTEVSREKGKGQNIWFGVVLVVAAGALVLGVPFDLLSFWLGLLFLVLAGMGSSFKPLTRKLFLVASLLFSLGPVATSINYTIAGDFYEKKPILCSRLDQPGRLYHTLGVIDSANSVVGGSILDAYDQLKGELVPNWPLAFGYEEVFDHNSFFQTSFLRWWYGAFQVDPALSRKLLDYLNVRYVLGDMPLKGLNEMSGTGTGTPVRENPTILPKWGSVIRAYPAQDLAQDLLLAAKPQFRFADQCFINDASLVGSYGRRRVGVAWPTTNQVLLQALGEERALLVSSELAYPGWTARVAGKPKAVLQVNHDFRGIVLEKSEQTVELRYQPTTFRLGLFLSLFVTMLWSGVFLARWRFRHA